MATLNANSPEDQAYVFLGCSYLFAVAYANYHQKLCTGKALKDRIERLVSEARVSPSCSGCSLQEIRKHVKYELKIKQEEYFEKYKRKFLMIDLCPELGARFELTFDWVLDNLAVLSNRT